MARIQILENPDVDPGSRIAVIASRYNQPLVDRLLDGCLKTLSGQGVDEDRISIIKVPGAFELPVLAKRLAGRREFDAIIALGAVIRGETPHFDYVAGECARGLARVALDFEMPVVFGVLTTDTEQQALDRAGEGGGNKGIEAARTALEMISVMRKLSP